MLYGIVNPELVTKLKEAEAGLGVASAQLANVLAGTRAEEIAQRKAAVESAAANLTLAQQTYDRIKELARTGNAPLQRLDEVTNSLQVAQRSSDAAKLADQEAVAGATPEQRGIARADVLEAQATIDTIKAQVDELTVKAPIAAQVYQIGAELGEYVSPGVPLLSLVDLSDVWLRFDLREDLVKGLKPGDRFEMRVPALARPADYCGNQGDRRQGRIRGLARDPRDRRLRPAHLRGSRLSGHANSRTPARDERLRHWPGGGQSKKPPRPGFLLVAAREWRWMRRDRLALFLAVGVPIFAFAILAVIFSSAVVRNLKVTVVDADRSPTSLMYVQAIASAPGVSVADRSGDMTSAMHAIRSGDAIAAIYIPENFERDLIARQRPRIVDPLQPPIFHSRQQRLGRSLQRHRRSHRDAASPVAGDRRTFAAGSLMVEQYVLTNPALNYAQFLLRAILPTVLHIVVAIAGGYAVGSEFSRRSLRAWLRAAGGSPLTALVGKLAPLFAIFVLMMVATQA